MIDGHYLDMMEEWLDYDAIEDDDFGTFDRCDHEWVKIKMITSIVYDCKKCGAKKEDL